MIRSADQPISGLFPGLRRPDEPWAHPAIGEELFYSSGSFCVWNHQKEFYVQKIWSRIGVGGPFTKTIVYLIQLLMKNQHFWPQPCLHQIRWRTTTGTSRTARFPTQRQPWSSKWRLTRAALMRWSEFLGQQMFCGLCLCSCGQCKVHFSGGNLLYRHTPDLEKKRHAMLSDISTEVVSPARKFLTLPPESKSP